MTHTFSAHRMNLLASSGDEGRRDDGRSLERPIHDGRGYYVHGGAQCHYYGDAERLVIVAEIAVLIFTTIM